MRARALAEAFPLARPDTDALAAARTMSEHQQPAVIVCRNDGCPFAVRAGPELLRALLPAYLQDEPGLARALDEAVSDRMCCRDLRMTTSYRSWIRKPPLWKSRP